MDNNYFVTFLIFIYYIHKVHLLSVYPFLQFYFALDTLFTCTTYYQFLYIYIDINVYINKYI